MTSARIAVTVAFLLVPVRPAIAQMAATDSVALPFERTVAAADLDPGRTHRIGDMVDAAGFTHSWSTDAFRKQIDVAATSGTGIGVPEMRIDGIPVRVVTVLGSHPELLPILPGAVEAVSVHRMPTGGTGLRAPYGRIDLVTRPMPEGVSLWGRVGLGNEIGDPGPFRYTPHDSPNVDRTGPAYEVGTSVRTGPLQLTAGVRGESVHMTDERILDRVRILYTGERRPFISLTGFAVSATLDSGSGRHAVRGGHTTLRDLRLTLPPGREVPLVQRVATVAGAGEAPLAGRWRWHYAWLVHRSEFANRFFDQEVGYRGTESFVDAELGFGTVSAERALRVTAGHTAHRLDAGRALADAKIAVPRLRFDGEWTGSRFWRRWVTVEATVSNLDPDNPNRAAISAAWRNRLGRGRMFVDLGVARSALLAESPAGEWFWLRRGWRRPGPGSASADVPLQMPDGAIWSADAALSCRGTALSATAGGFLRVFRNVTLDQVVARPDTAFPGGFVGSATYRTGIDGRVAGVRAEIEVHAAPWHHHRLRIQHAQTATASDDPFRTDWARRPRLEARYDLEVRPSERSALRLAVRYRSSVRWGGILSATDASGIATAERVAPVLLVDLSAEKRLWGNRLDVYLALTNLARATDRSHPLGPVEDLTFRVGAQARFGLSPRG